MITVYTLPGCGESELTVNYLKDNGIAHEVVSIHDNKEAAQTVVDRGFHSTPTVITDTDAWAGFNTEKLATLS